MDFEKSTLTLIDGLLLALIIGCVAFGVNFVRDRRDKRRIYQLLRETPGVFRSTTAISSETGIGVERVRKVCELDHERIRRNEREKESWTLR